MQPGYMATCSLSPQLTNIAKQTLNLQTHLQETKQINRWYDISLHYLVDECLVYNSNFNWSPEIQAFKLYTQLHHHTIILNTSKKSSHAIYITLFLIWNSVAACYKK